MDQYASRFCHQLPRYIVWQSHHQRVATDAFQLDCKYQLLYAFPPLLMIERVLRKVQKDHTNMTIVIHTWQSQSRYLILLKIIFKNTISSSNHPKVLFSPERKIHPLIQNSSMRLVTWLVSGSIYLQKEYQERLSALSQMPKEQVFSQITNYTGENRLASVIGSKLMPLVNI